MKATFLIFVVFLFLFSSNYAVSVATSAHKSGNPIIKPTLTDKPCKNAQDCKQLGFGYSCDPSSKKCRKYF